MMDFLSQLLQGVQHTQPNQQRLMEVGPNGQPRLSSQGNLPAAQQKDTWLEGGQPQPYRAFAGHMQQVPIGQPLSNQDISRLDPRVQPLAQIYNQNPQDPRVAHLDPAMFGYAPDGPVQFNVGNPTGNNVGFYHDSGIDSIGGRIGQPGVGHGQYGGTVGIDNGKVFANMNHNGHPTDPLTELRHFLGL